MVHFELGQHALVPKSDLLVEFHLGEVGKGAVGVVGVLPPPCLCIKRDFRNKLSSGIKLLQDMNKQCLAGRVSQIGQQVGYVGNNIERAVFVSVNLGAKG